MRQIKLVLTLIFLVLSQLVIGQDFVESWVGHFSYLDIKDVSQGSFKVFGAAENAIFIYDKQSNEIQKLSTINGLSGETISNIHYAEETGLLLIGFENGLIQIYIESSQEVKTVVDILEKPTIPSVSKRINHFNIHNGYAYISTNYGISLYDINNLEFGDTYFIGANGSQIVVNQTTVFEGNIYAATEMAIFKADVDNANLIDYQQWVSFSNGNWVGIQSSNSKLFVAKNNTILYEIVADNIVLIEDYSALIQDIRDSEGKLVVTTLDEVHVYSVDPFVEIAIVVPNDEFNTKFSSAEVSLEDEIFIGTKNQESLGKSGFGILKTEISNTEAFQEIHPESPLSNKFFQIGYQSNQLWAVHGGHSITYNLSGGTAKSGISHLVENEWQNISYDSLTTISTNPWYLSYLSINPFNSEEVYFSSYYRGLIERTSEGLTLYNQNNSTIVPFAGSFHLPLASNYDPFGDLWVMNGRVNFALNRFSNGVWNSYSLLDVIDPATSNLGFSSIEFDTNNNVFIGSHNYGLIGFKENNGNPIVKNIYREEANVPSTGITSVVLDKQNQLWFGTYKGIRVIYNTDEFFEDPDYEPSEIIIIDDGTPRELFFQQYVTDIEVDGANNKWIATLDTGAYYMSSDGQETIYHFTKDNSPLPTNDVLDIEIDDINGLVYIATDQGMVAFNSETSVPDSTLEEAYVYPNPVRPNFNINDKKIKIKGITGNVNIKITDIEGNLVTEAETRTNTKFRGYNLEIDGGTALWNGKNMSGRTVATGVYLVMLSDLDSFETKVLKLMIVR
ncbi:two-component regulator propeller domain-containing protein [Lacinutrix algicola]|uniref:type IX secretion system anionic LPS delivery protein PorZ n=1 Tax=Lacinutrix algicola TaxID=342954 RepID=UPI0006E31DD6|nr:two-component regulator propeller domain-containing protein [Lacinutrix algicola]